MKKLFLTLAIVAVSAMLFATNPVSIEDAKLVSKNYLTQFSGKDLYKTSDFTLMETVYSEDGEPAFYRFQIKDKGFILVSATKMTTPVLALSLENDFSTDEQTNYFTRRYQVETQEARNSAVQPSSIKQAWNYFNSTDFRPAVTKDGESAYGVEPLITTLWSQGEFYNQMCPIDNRDGAQPLVANNDYRALVGCVAVTMANYLFFHQYPTSGVGITEYVPRDIDSETGELLFEYARQRVNFADHEYDYTAIPQGSVWGNGYGMVDNYAGEMGELLYHTGVSCFMGYGMAGSGAASGDAFDAMKRNWKMDAAGIYSLLDISGVPSQRLQDSVKMRQYQDSLMANLDRRVPIGFNGGVFVPNQTSTDGECIDRHSFFIDGYYRIITGAYYDAPMFHVNMGWGGYGNGYYQFGNLNRYSCEEGVMLKIVPPDSLYQQNVIKPIEGVTEVVASSGTITDGSGSFLYKPNTNRTWNVAAPGATAYKVFFSKIKTQEGDEIIIKKGDGTVVGTYSGNYLMAHTGDAPVGVYDGEVLPDVINIAGDSFTVEFTTNGDTLVDYGFVLGYDAAIPSDDTFCPNEGFGNSANNRSSHGFISDKGFVGVTPGQNPEEVLAGLMADTQYPVKDVCEYTTPNFAYVSGFSMNFRKFDIGEGDIVEIFEPTGTSSFRSLAYTFTKENPPGEDIAWDFSKFKVRFISDNRDAGTGFVLEYFAISGVEDNESGIVETKIYPNPATDNVNVFVSCTDLQDVTFQVTDLTGKVIAAENQQVVGEYTHTMNVNNLSKGMYIMNILTQKGKSTYKFIVE